MAKLFYNERKDLFKMIENYIFLYHLNKYIVLPSFVDSVQDIQQVNFAPSNPLSRSAPIYSYQYSGPRTVQVSFNLHRDLMTQINKNVSNVKLKVTDDYVDVFIKYIQAAALPSYETAAKMVNPPIVAMRLGNDIFIKGVIQGSIGLTYYYPILETGRYANVSISFTVAEIDPYDAKNILELGSFRNVSTSLERSNIILPAEDDYPTPSLNDLVNQSLEPTVSQYIPQDAYVVNNPIPISNPISYPNSIVESGKKVPYGGKDLNQLVNDTYTEPKPTTAKKNSLQSLVNKGISKNSLNKLVNSGIARI